MIEIIFGKPGRGKTLLEAHKARELAFNAERNRLQKMEIERKALGGFAVSPMAHCVCSNFDMCFKKFGYSRRFATRVNPFRLGFANDFVETQFIAPYSAVFINEAQKYFNSRMSRFFPDWQSRYYETHRHNDLTFVLDTQRPMLIDVNIRELAFFTEIVNDVELRFDSMGHMTRAVWQTRHIDSSFEFDLYVASGKRDKVYIEEEIVADYDVGAIYDSQGCKPKFYDGHFDDDYARDYTLPPMDEIDSYLNWLEQYDDEMPDNFYKRIADKGKE